MAVSESFGKKLKMGYASISQAVLRPVSTCRGFFAFTMLMVYAIAVTGNLLNAWTDPFLSFLLPISDCYLICLVACFLRKIRLHWPWFLVIGFLLFAELFTIFFYHSNFTIFVVQLILETNTRESSEFIVSTLFTLPTLYTLLLTATAVATAYGLSRLSHTAFCGKGILRFLLFGLIIWSGLRQLSAYSKLWHCFFNQTTAECTRSLPHQNTPFVRLLYGTAFNIASSAELDILNQSVAATTVDSCSYRCPLIVLIIGESYNKHHASLYNPEYLPTTPRMEHLRRQGNLYPFTDVVAPFNMTSSVFKYMFSTWDDECTDDWTQHTLFTAVFKKAGFHVHFITNQFTVNAEDNWDVAGGTIFNHPELSRQQFTSRNEFARQYDGELLADIPSTDSLTAHPTLLIFHMVGQHVRYADKYPVGFARFTANDETTTFGGEEGKQTAAHYDNATYYNDYVVDSLFNMLNDTEAIAIYLSDHGEEVYDWRSQFERTGEATMPAEVARYQYEIPFICYMTDSFMIRHNDVLQAVKEATEKPFISSDLCHMLFSLAGISCPDYQEQKDLLSPSYNTHRRRIIRYDVDYDALINTLR